MSPVRRVTARVFAGTESATGLVVVAAVVVALVWANLGPGGYESLWTKKLTVGLDPWGLSKDLRHWVNDGLMTLFFFVVGLEVKRELVIGELRRPRAAAVPLLAGVSGAVLPALLFVALAGAQLRSAWGIPMATDVALAVGVLALLGRRVPAGARLLLLSIAIVDDVLAILVIAVVYTDALAVGWLATALGALAVVVLLRRFGAASPWAYAVPGLVAWWATAQSGVHATVAGVALAALTPATPVAGRQVLQELEHRLHPLSAWLAVPLFALANAGVRLDGVDVGGRLALAITVGLLVGKPLGVAGSVLVARRFGLVALPRGLDARRLWGLGALAGIGFTVSLFVAGLAVDSPLALAQAKVAVLGASTVAAVVGVLLLRGRRLAGGAASAASPRGARAARRSRVSAGAGDEGAARG